MAEGSGELALIPVVRMNDGVSAKQKANGCAVPRKLQKLLGRKADEAPVIAHLNQPVFIGKVAEKPFAAGVGVKLLKQLIELRTVLFAYFLGADNLRFHD